MSVVNCSQPECLNSTSASVLLVIEPRAKDLGGFSVSRVLPATEHKRVGPFIFFDHLGPATFAAGTGIDVRPHPHIGLSTLTYLFTGEMIHRDSLGYVQSIEPGAVNWMTAGRGIVHSERTSEAKRATGFAIHGLQIWIALPDGQEEIEPSFAHYPAGSLPLIAQEKVEMSLVAGEAFGQRSPVHVHSPLFYLDVRAQPGANIAMPGQYEERALYIVEGELKIDQETFAERHMVVLAPGCQPEITALTESRVMMLGGAPLASDRIVWWNFSSSSRARIDQAKADWKTGRFDPVPGDSEFIPLP